MILLSAVSLGSIFAFGLAQDGALTAPLSRSLSGYALARTVEFEEQGSALGLGVTISADGLVLTPGEVAFGPAGQPREALKGALSGKTLAARVVAFDSATDLALVALPSSSEGYPYAELANRLSANVVLVVLADGPARGQIAVSGVSGVMAQNSRYLPLNEIRLDSAGMPPTGAPVFLPDGKLVGLISAELQSEPAAEMAMPTALAAPSGMRSFAAKMGPTAPSTTFALDLPVLERVITGFRSASRVIEHPWVGLFFKSGPAPARGAQITEVVEGSPGALAGIRVGDVVIGSAQMPFRSHVDFAAYLFSKEPGEVIRISVMRGPAVRTVEIRLAREPHTTDKLVRKVRG